MKLNTRQQQSLMMGKLRRHQLIKASQRAVMTTHKDSYPHSYIYSLGGLGKTHNVIKSVEEQGVPFVTISGKNSDWAFALGLALIYYKKEKGQSIRIIVDDCDALLSDSFVNTLKNMLEGEKKLVYNKHIHPMYLDTDEKKKAVEHLSNGVGFTVPCDEFIFIFTSNYKLPTSNEAMEAEKKGPGRSTQKIINLNAIRTRVMTKDIIFQSEQEWWGWIADAVLNDGALDQYLEEDQCIELLRWMFNHWKNLTGRDLRTAQQLAAIMCSDEDYEDVWEQDYIDHNSKKIGDGSL